MTDFHDAEDAKRYRARLRKQQRYSQNYRDKLEAANIPDRDEMARACLTALVDLLAAGPDAKTCGLVPGTMVSALQEKGFSRDGTMDRLRGMVRRARSKVQAHQK
ncbi:hypothetical protein [Enterovirga aerilata]|nr:hypothetical protein [Enterovirga sp. DB1703]